MKYLNIACGNTFIKNKNWTNIDFSSNDKSIKKVNILKGLAFESNTFDVVYSSHFVEHIPNDQLPSFLKECKRVLKPGGIIRIVTPDFNFLCSEYLKNYQNNYFKKSDFINALMIDQCVRRKRGGLLQKQLEEILNGDDEEFKKYVLEIIGNESMNFVNKLQSKRGLNIFFKRILSNPYLIFDAIDLARNHFLSLFFSKGFRDQNISFAAKGEKHTWLYDFESLKNQLDRLNFKKIEKKTYCSSHFTENIFKDLDEFEGRPRKGTHQFFLEALK